jgi:hypothetical protein
MTKNRVTYTLLEKGLISTSQGDEIKQYKDRTLFSVRNEILLLYFLAVTFFVSGSSIVIYKNIDTIGHVAILGIILCITIICFYFSFKQAPGFSKEEVVAVTPVHAYLVLAANLLSGVFVAYLQYQYSVFGTRYGLATLAPTLLYFFSAYFFDHKGVLSLAISGLCAFVGFSTSPRALLEFNFSNDLVLTYSAIILGILLLVWAFYSEKTGIKKHFSTTYRNFALHIICIASITNLFDVYWFFSFLVIGITIYYFIRLACKTGSMNFFVFSLIYGYIALNCVLGKLIGSLELYTLIIYLSPFYFIASILFFRKCIKDFKNRVIHDSV